MFGNYPTLFVFGIAARFDVAFDMELWTSINQYIYICV
jgi:hypothetical protein